jgi:type II secretory pathway pseudopilin PulG
MRRLLPWWPRDRRQAQSGATLVELLVSVAIMGFALVLIVGTFSTGLIQATLAKRNTAATAVVQYELDQISGAQYGSLPRQYSDCFATDAAQSLPTQASGGICPDSTYTLRVDVTMLPGPTSTTQTWSVTVISLSNGAQVGTPVNIVKANR